MGMAFDFVDGVVGEPGLNGSPVSVVLPVLYAEWAAYFL